MNIRYLMEHIVKEVGVGDEAKYAFMYGYMSGLIDDMILQFPETRELLESHARKYSYKENV